MVIDVLSKNTAALKRSLTRDYLPVSDHLKNFLKDPRLGNALKALSWWDTLAQEAGIDAAVLRQDAAALRKKHVGDLVGCGWYRCVQYRREYGTSVFYWCHCRKVLYCGDMCQSR